MPLVSIIIPAFNSSQLLPLTLKSVFSQVMSNWEVIVIDDFSTDNTVEVIKKFMDKEPRIKLIQLTENSGAAVARNFGIEAAQGRYIAFLDSDDIWLPDKLQKQLIFMESNDYPFTYAAYDIVDDLGRKFGHVGVPDNVSYSDLLKVCSIGCLTAVYDTEYFGKVYMPLIRKRQDLGLWLRLLRKVDCAHGLNETLARYRIRGDSISANKMSAAKFTWRLYRDVEGLNFFKSSYYFLHYAVNGLLRTKFPKLARFIGVLK